LLSVKSKELPYQDNSPQLFSHPRPDPERGGVSHQGTKITELSFNTLFRGKVVDVLISICIVKFV